MMINTSINQPISHVLLKNYFESLVNRFFKILPMRENHEDSLPVYMKGLQAELIGCKSFIPDFDSNSLYMSLLCILQYLIDIPDCSVKDTKREVFGAISICNKLAEIYGDMSVEVPR